MSPDNTVLVHFHATLKSVLIKLPLHHFELKEIIHARVMTAFGSVIILSSKVCNVYYRLCSSRLMSNCHDVRDQ